MTASFRKAAIPRLCAGIKVRLTDESEQVFSQATYALAPGWVTISYRENGKRLDRIYPAESIDSILVEH